MRRSSRFQRPGLSGSSRSVVLLGGDGGGPSLDLDFSFGTLDPRITFTRSTIGTYYRGAFNQNLVTQSETFSGWYTEGVTPAPSGESNPQNSGNAYGITESATTTLHRFGRSTATVAPSSQVTASAYIKAGIRTLVGLGNNQITASTVTFQLTGSGSFGALPANVLSASITPVGNGWYRCSVTFLAATNGTVTTMLNVYTGTVSSPTGTYAGDNTAPALYVWGVQTTEGSLLTPYIPTTTAAITQGQIASSQPWNLLLQSQAFDNTTSWTNTIGGTGVNPVRTANNAVAPDGTMTADTITFDAGAGTTSSDISMIGQGLTALTSGRAYTMSLWIRASSGNPQIIVRHVGTSSYTLVTATSAWQRISITEVAASTTSTPQFGIRQGQTGIGTINSTATVELWGAQLNEGTTALDYNPTTTLANYLPRFEYNPVSGAFRGLLIEGGATNLCLQSADLATTWVNQDTTESTDVITAPDGTVSADSMIDTATTGIHGIFQAISGQSTTATYTISAFLKKGTMRYVVLVNWMSGSNHFSVVVDMDNPTQGNLVTGAVGAGTSVSGATITSVGNGWYRVSVTGVGNQTAHYPAVAHRTTAYSGTGTVFESYAGNTANLTYVWGFQYEAQAFASSYIPTVAATVARAADSASITGTNFSSWYNQSEGTLLCFHAGRPTSSSGRGAEINNNTSDERHALSSGGGSAQYVCTDNGSTQASIGFTIPDVDQKRYAAAYRVNDFGLSINGNTTLTDLTGNLPTVDRLWIGASSASASFLQSSISRIAYWPTRLPNDQLVSLTTIPSTALATTAIQAGAKIDLTWTQVPGVAGATYEVERSTDGGATWSPLTTSFGLAFNDTTALFPGTYTYRVRANVGGEVTDWSSQVSEITVDVPAAPGGLTVTGATTSSISLSWTDSTGEDFYRIEVSPDGFPPWSFAGTAPANTTTFTHTPLNESTQRYYRVNGINKAGGGLYSSTVNSWTVPLAPTSLTATAISSIQIDLAWTDVSTGNQSYKVERSTDNVNWTQIATGLAANATSYSAVGLTGSTLYYFRVRAANAARDSAYSNTASATTQAGGLTPAWSLDFSTGTPSGYTLTRASSATRVDSSGYVASASTDVARLTHNSSGSRLGLLVEGSATNLAQYSEDFANAYWTKSSLVTIDDNGGSFWTSPANASDAVLLEQVSGTSIHNILRQFTAVTNICFSLFAKKQTTSGVGRYVYIILRGAGSDYAAAVFDLDAGTVSQSSNVGSTWSSVGDGIEDYGNGWYRCHIRGTRTSASTNVYVGLANSGTPTLTNTGQTYNAANSTDGVYIWGAMYEARNGLPTSYIETPSNASVTRSADLAHVLDSAITSWGDPGALVVHFYPPGQAGTLISTDDASTAQVGIEASPVTDVRAFWSSGSTAAETMTTGVQKAVHYWNGSSSKFCINGGTVQTGTNNLTIGNTDFVTLGAEATESGGVPGTFSQYANCIIRKVEFYSGTLTDANLQTITT